MHMTVEFSREELLKLYEIQLNDLKMRHGAIWTEVKHYTWVLSMLLAAPFVSYVNVNTKDDTFYLLLLLVSIFGSLLAATSILIIKKDFSYYTLSDSRLLFYEKQLGLTAIPEIADERMQRANGDFNAVDDARSENRFQLGWIKNLKMRFLILFVFFCYFIAGITMSVIFYSLYQQQLLTN